MDALNDVGISSVLADTHAQLATKITTAKKTGVVLTPGAVDVPIPKGIYDADGGKVLGDPDLIASNILSGKSIFGVPGSVLKARQATGVVSFQTSGNANSWNVLTVSSLNFQPNCIFFNFMNNCDPISSEFRNGSFCGQYMMLDTVYTIQRDSSNNMDAEVKSLVATSNGFTALVGSDYNGYGPLLQITWVAVRLY